MKEQEYLLEKASADELPAAIATFVDLLEWRAYTHPDRQACLFFHHDRQSELTYRELQQHAKALGAWLQRATQPGSRVLLLYPPGLDFIVAFSACLYAGVIAVPAYPPHPNRQNRSLLRLSAIIANAQPAVVLTTAGIYPTLQTLLPHIPDTQQMRWLSTDTYPANPLINWQEPAITGATLAFLQYTSGSTATPRGVMVSHHNLLANEEMIKQAMANTSASTLVSWLPLYHDMGLIGCLLQALYIGTTCVLQSPAAFLQHPMRWLQTISHVRARVSGAPNFAYDLCVRKITAGQREQLDLSCWQVAFNGAEPIRQQTLEAFAAAFAPCGFRPQAFFPCYGLAEATLFVSGPPADAAAMPRSCVLLAKALEHRRVELAAPHEPETRTLVGCGRCWGEQQVRIVDPDTCQVCAPEQIGEIWICGDNAAQGYWNDQECSRQTMGATIAGETGHYVRSGDLGFLKDGELFIAGRIKDVIIIDGRNHYPQDIEYTVERSHAALRPGCSSAFAVTVDGREKLVIVAEVEHRVWQRAQSQDSGGAGQCVAWLEQAIKQAVMEAHDVPTFAVSLLKPGGVPKTSSGKVQRHACRQGFLASTLETVE
ncbi:MAG TPA: fatty acyl-AMP ligase [Ktedonobacteraceae bacterium]|jgi:acyl-CoA synthetase (AMP-forming)/AMP-acid ligase II